MGTYQRWHYIYMGIGEYWYGDKWGVLGVGLRHPYLGYLPITRRTMCPPRWGVGEERGVQWGWLETIVMRGLRSGGVT